MHRLGISVYPEHSTEEKDFAYMEMAAGYGFTRIFTCLLSVTESRENIMKRFTRFVDKAHELGYEVTVDTNPQVFKHLGASPYHVKPFADMHVDVIRLDLPFNDVENLAIIGNPYGIKVEFNGSFDNDMGLLVKRGADPDKVMMCHNFYPQRYTGLGWDLFMRLNRNWKAAGLHNAAFVSSNNSDTFGPWPVSAGLPTCEIHRDLPVDLQLRHILAAGNVDDVLVGNAFASEEELASMASVDLGRAAMRIELEEGLSEGEMDILFHYAHGGRGDASDYMLRSYYTRFFYKDKGIPARTYGQPVFRRGDVLVVNDNLAHYRGELQVVLKDMPNDGQRNLLGRIPEQEMMILDLIRPEVLFGFIK